MGEVTWHSLTEDGKVEIVDIKFGNKTYENVNVKHLKPIKMEAHGHPAADKDDEKKDEKADEKKDEKKEEKKEEPKKDTKKKDAVEELKVHLADPKEVENIKK